jgi:mannose-6-phosphate isomerase-like protein (cupin superfamily)
MTSSGQLQATRHAAATAGKAVICPFETAYAEHFRPGFTRRIVYTGSLMMVVLDIDNGPWQEPDPPHSHPHEQTAYVVEGEVLFFCEGFAPITLKAGDTYAIPPNIPHGIKLLSKTARLIDCFTPIRQDFLSNA